MADVLYRNARWLALALSLVVSGLELISYQFPLPKPLDAAPSDFSAERAHRVLAELLRENEPHPVGSATNRRVKERVIANFRGLGLEVEEQRSVGCSRAFASCAFVENVVATLRGSNPGPAVLLMAHYDSVPAGPGAGDDGAGVAALLEVARALALEAPLRNSLVGSPGTELEFAL